MPSVIIGNSALYSIQVALSKLYSVLLMPDPPSSIGVKVTLTSERNQTSFRCLPVNLMVVIGGVVSGVIAVVLVVPILLDGTLSVSIAATLAVLMISPGTVG